MEQTKAKSRVGRLERPWLASLYFLRHLPSAWWWGLRVRTIEEDHAEVTIPYNWRTKNPFRSIYFAALAGAGELATGLLALKVLESLPPTSMLVIEQQAEFVKKANTLTTFRCDQGAEVATAVQRAVETGEPQTVRMTATGRNAAGEVVARIHITWSFKRKG